jgi:hypothetical protein
VALTATGCVTRVQVWLTDGVSSEVLAIPDGAVLADVTLMLVAQVTGTWHLYAEVLDAAGVPQRTGLVRVVKVAP